MRFYLRYFVRDMSLKAGRLGFEPRLMEPESTVLPLNYLPISPTILE